jgi:hypothetical protein
MMFYAGMLFQRGTIMAGFELLSTGDIDFLISTEYKGDDAAQKFDLSNDNVLDLLDIGLDAAGRTPIVLSTPITYFLLPSLDNIRAKIIISTVLSSSDFGSQFKKIHRALYKRHEALGDLSLIFSLQGRGSTENHIIAAYATISANENSPVTLIDSKTTTPERFFGEKDSNPVGVVFKALIRSFSSNPDRGKYQVSQEDGQTAIDVTLITTGTESFLDGTTCGHHAFAAMNACVKLLDEKRNITGANVLGLRETGLPILGNPVRKGQMILKTCGVENQSAKVKSNILDFLGDAWSKTYGTGENGNTPFIDYPSKGTAAQKVAYFIPTFRFLTATLTNMVKLPTELVVQGVAEFFHFLQTQLMALAPRNPALQGLRTLALGLTLLCRGIFLGLSRVLRCVFSPIESAKEALKVEPKGLGIFLCVLSVVVSLAAYAGIAIFAAPLLFAALPSLSVAVAQPVLSALGSSATFLATIIGTPTALAGLAIVGTSLLYGARSLFDRICFSSSSKEGASVVPQGDDSENDRRIEQDCSTSDDDDYDNEEDPPSFSEASGPETDSSDSDDNNLVNRLRRA